MDPQIAQEIAGRLMDEIVRAGSCCCIDDVRWDHATGRFDGSFLWHGVPTSVPALQAFADFASRIVFGDSLPDVIAGVSSSGIAWATAAALRLERPIGILRLTRHQYGVDNPDLRRYSGGRVWVVDNFVGSGDTLGRAADLLAKMRLTVVRTLAVEASRQHPVHAPLRTETKLADLVSRGYFRDMDSEVVRRYLCEERRGLDDAVWVRCVQQELARRREKESKPDAATA